MKTILIVDDEPRTREGIRKVLEGWSAGRSQIVTAANGVEAWTYMQLNEVELMITDIRMPELGGLDLVEQAAALPHPPMVIIISGHPEFDYAQRAMQLGITEYLLKPIDKIKLVQAVESALKRREDQMRVEWMEKLVDTKLLETVQHDNAYSPQVQEAIRYMDSHLDGQISLRDIADQLHMNASYFSVLFKEQTGLTFTEYLTRRRVQRAKELLSGTRATIAEVAEKVGYQTDKYFAKVFRSVEGTSPGQYRKSVAHRDDTIQ